MHINSIVVLDKNEFCLRALCVCVYCEFPFWDLVHTIHPHRLHSYRVLRLGTHTHMYIVLLCTLASPNIDFITNHECYYRAHRNVYTTGAWRELLLFMEFICENRIKQFIMAIFSRASI